jgi:hypothetical protein
MGEGRVSADSLVWCEGWADWQTAATIFPELSGGVAAIDPLDAAANAELSAKPVSSAPARSTGNPSRATYRGRKKNSNTVAIAAVVTLGFMAMVLLVVLVFVIRGT